MLSISAPLGAGQGEYYANLASEDYYLGGGEPPGQWVGEGAAKLGLSGEIDSDQFRQLFAGYLRREKLVQNAGRESRVCGFDLTFSAPKSVSVAWSQASPEVALEIRAAQQMAVEKALAFLEQEAGYSRTGKNGTQIADAKLIFATFEHGTSRAQEPQLHTHCILINAAVRPDESTGSLYINPVYKHKMAAGALYRAELAYQLQRRLGFELERDPDAKFSFRLQEVSRELEKAFSTRRREVEEHLAMRGLSGAVASAQMAVFSRSNKAHASREELAETWAEVGRKHGFGPAELERILEPDGKPERVFGEVAALLQSRNAIENLTMHQSTFSKADLVRATAEEAQFKGISSERVLAAIDETLERHAISLGARPQSGNLPQFQPRFSEPRYTTQEILDLETRLLSQVSAGIGQCRARVSGEVAEAAIASRATIKEEQAKAVRYLTTGVDQVKTVTGQAGTGKTFMLEVAHEAWTQEGYAVYGMAPSAKAARGLEESGIPSSTIHSWLWQADNGRLRIDSRSVLIMDEAGMTDTRIMARVVDEVQRTGATLVCVGDAGQLQAVEQGGAFKAMDERLGHDVKLTEIIRQEREADREAVRHVIAGQADQALRHFLDQGQLQVAESREQAREALLATWKTNGLARPEEQLIFTGTNQDATILNREIQAERVRTGWVSSALQSVEVGNERVHRGDRVLFTKNNKAMGVQNGMLATVQEVNPLFGIIAVLVDGEERTRTIAVHQYDDLKLGYAVTTHKGQGMTIPRAFVLTHETMQDKELSYVQLSRAKLETQVFTTKIEAGQNLSNLARAMQRSHQKELAISQSTDSLHSRLRQRREQDQDRDHGITHQS